jgi:hypothetical protein
MRAALPAVALVCAGLVGTACLPDKRKEPEWQKPPKAFDPQEAELTFNKKQLEAFNAMSGSDREAHVQALRDKPGSFKGQATFQRATELGEAMDDAEYGRFEVYATLPDPVLYEITVEYQLFSNEEIGKGLPPNTYIEFTGTLASLRYHDESKPRKLEIKVKDVEMNVLED